VRFSDDLPQSLIAADGASNIDKRLHFVNVGFAFGETALRNIGLLNLTDDQGMAS
jgi:hypothetical protein